MQVNPSNSFSPVTPSPVTNNPSAGAAGKAGDGGAAPLGDSSFTPTSDLNRLLAKVRDLPDVRADQVKQVTDRLSEQTTPQAAAAAAQSLLDSGDLR